MLIVRTRFKYRHDFVRDVLFDIFRRAGVSVKKEANVNFMTDLLDRRSTLRHADVMVYGCVGGKLACMDLTRVSPLVGSGVGPFTVGQTSLKATSSKVAKHKKACSNCIVLIQTLMRTIVSAHEYLSPI
jgi:hypothetical protein